MSSSSGSSFCLSFTGRTRSAVSGFDFSPELSVAQFNGVAVDSTVLRASGLSAQMGHCIVQAGKPSSSFRIYYRTWTRWSQTSAFLPFSRWFSSFHLNEDIVIPFLLSSSDSGVIVEQAGSRQGNRSPQYRNVEGAVLIFLPGLADIQQIYDLLSSDKRFNDRRRYKLIALHSILSSQDQAEAFVLPPAGTRKIVLATNIAETGITIPDVVFVVDAGRTKENRYHESSQMSSLVETFISKASALQRQGRAGRVRDGFCFRLYTKERLQQELYRLGFLSRDPHRKPVRFLVGRE
ncbi:unnamed protein product [Ranitomeya imitator]|uniref:Helicase C-terminal domain-containing protein n=1 Tax=Ranitomeya imitator TaxID=111125 RepID=A0ABN9LEX7_9NEOB|nr:unnamed protein product [Ranitomeya imitator]